MAKPGKRVKIYSLIVVATAIALALFLLHPATSPFARFHDADGDGVADAKDAFPDSAIEWDDSDLDGVGDNGDSFPLDVSEWNDTDEDGYGDNGDLFRTNPNEWNDTDGDGYGDNAQDSFPLDAGEWHDTDGDSVGDNDDFKADGNGMIQVCIERFGGWYEDYSALDKVDPYFLITVSENFDNGTSNARTNSTQVFQETTHLLNSTACISVHDIDDSVDSINVTVVVKDAAGDVITASDSVIDYTGSAASRYATYLVHEPYNIYRRNDGMRDNVSNEMDCEIGILVEQHPRASPAQEQNQTIVAKTIRYSTQAFSGWVLNGTYEWIEEYRFVRTLKDWNDIFNEYYSYDPATDFVPDFRNFSYVMADWGMQYGLYSISVVGMELRNTTLNVFVEKTVPGVYWGEVIHVHHLVAVPNEQLMYENITQTVFYEYQEYTGFSTGSVVLFYIHI